MRMRMLFAGMALAGTALLSACGSNNPPVAGSAIVTNDPTETSSSTPSSSAAAETTTVTTAPPVTTTTAPVTSTSKPKPKVTTTKPKPKVTTPATPAAGTPCTITNGACVDLSATKAWLIENGKVIYGPVPMTSGRPGYRTPPGTFHVQWKDIDHKSKEFNDAPMPYSVFFYNGMAFHSGSLSVQSHGCIHLSTAAAKMFYNNLSVGEAVQVVA
jgi:lipoprotein-anchoring transpeptidase ErfK/SrfK